MPELAPSVEEPARAAADPGSAFSDVVEALCRVTDGMLESSDWRSARRVLPSRADVAALFEDFRVLLFPTCFGPAGLSGHRLRYYVGARLDELREALFRQVRAGLSFRCGHPALDARATCAACEAGAHEVTD